MYSYGDDWRKDLDGSQQAEFWNFLLEDVYTGVEDWGQVAFALYAAS